jgi:iron complex transport system ATP-binding protein
VIGKNGAGKTTLLKTLCGLLTPVKGKIQINHTDLKEMSHMERARLISYVMPNTGLIPDITVKDVVTMGRFPYTGWLKPHKSNDFSICEAAIAQTGIQQFVHKQFHQLSDGEKQRVLFAMALAQDTPFMLFDEPAAFLDIPARNHIYSHMYRLAKTNSKSVIFTTHDIRQAIRICDVLWVFTPDGIIAGMPEELGINGVFDHIFPEDNLIFEQNIMDFTPSEKKHSLPVDVKGTGTVFDWSLAILKRLGYSPGCNITAPISVIVDENGKQWHIRSEKINACFFSCTEFAEQMKNLT